MADSLNGQTIYVILASADGGSTWTVQGRQPASGKHSALSHFYETHDLPGAEPPQGEVLFQAIPSSTWKLLRPAPPRLRTMFAEVT